MQILGQKVLDRLGKHRNSIEPNSEKKYFFFFKLGKSRT